MIKCKTDTIEEDQYGDSDGEIDGDYEYDDGDGDETDVENEDGYENEGVLNDPHFYRKGHYKKWGRFQYDVYS